MPPLAPPTHCVPLSSWKRLHLLWAVAFFLLAGQGNGSAADPTADQQYWLELVNRFRAAPQAELDKLVNMSSPGVWDTPRSDDPSIAYALSYFGVSAADLVAQFGTLSSAPPLAWSSILNSSATSYSNLMVTHDQQSHYLDGHIYIEDRLMANGYSSNWLEAGENLFAQTQNMIHGHAGFVIDWGDGNGGAPGFGNGIQNPAGHREVLLNPLMKEIGIGFQSIAIPGSNVFASGPNVVTQHFGSRYRVDGFGDLFADAILTGSVYQDTIAADLFYTPGEGMAGVLVDVYSSVTNLLVASGLTNSAGGFNIELLGLTDGISYWVEAPSTGLGRQYFTLNAHVENYNRDVTYYDNVYASFAVVPEPGGAWLCFAGALHLLARRTRRRHS